VGHTAGYGVSENHTRAMMAICIFPMCNQVLDVI
jgi:hypothetical protein